LITAVNAICTGAMKAYFYIIYPFKHIFCSNDNSVTQPNEEPLSSLTGIINANNYISRIMTLVPSIFGEDMASKIEI
jgi:hypothetical protein